MTVTFDAPRPKMQRVVAIQVGGRPLDPSATHRVATIEGRTVEQK